MALTAPFAMPNSVPTPRIEALFTLASIAVSVLCKRLETSNT
jgi:hypothetical protein